MEQLHLSDDEPEWEIRDEGEQAEQQRQSLCLVGRFLTNKPIRVHMMKDRMGDIWQPGRGVTINEVEPGIFVFKFYHPLDIQKVMKLGSWSFDNHLLILSVLQEGVVPSQVPLYTVPFWVQVHNLPTRFMSAAVGEQIANFMGEFLEYDAKNNSNFLRAYMRIRVLIDVRKPLKQSRKIKKSGLEAKTVLFKYERLGSFCYLYGLLGHVDSQCQRLFDMVAVDGVRKWTNTQA